MKLKNLDLKISLEGIKVKTPTGIVGYWKSQWGYSEGKAGVWLSDGKTTRVYPIFLNKLSEAMEWDIAEENEKVNCDKKQYIKYTDLTTDNKWFMLKQKKLKEKEDARKKEEVN